MLLAVKDYPMSRSPISLEVNDRIIPITGSLNRLVEVGMNCVANIRCICTKNAEAHETLPYHTERTPRVMLVR